MQGITKPQRQAPSTLVCGKAGDGKVSRRGCRLRNRWPMRRDRVSMVGPGSSAVASGPVLVPRVVWVTIAGVLNYQVIQLNGPFG